MNQSEIAMASFHQTQETMRQQLKQAMDKERENEQEVAMLKKKLSQYVQQAGEA